VISENVSANPRWRLGRFEELLEYQTKRFVCDSFDHFFKSGFVLKRTALLKGYDVARIV
jgi:hypothetical protein